MNKKGSWVWTLTGILLVLIIVVVLVPGIGKLLWNAGKSALGIYNLFNLTEVDYSKLNQDAKLGFNSFIKDIRSCKDSQDNNCLCYPSFSGFNAVHQIEINDKEIKLVNIKDNNAITMQKENVQDFNCYYNKDGANTEDSLIINFDKDLPAIKKGFFSNNINFYNNPAIYKSDKICLVSTGFDLTKISKVCKI
ncbi:MAG: hypothetical protein AABW45_03595 [Nanoarchaeota archaeon]